MLNIVFVVSLYTLVVKELVASQLVPKIYIPKAAITPIDWTSNRAKTCGVNFQVILSKIIICDVQLCKLKSPFLKINGANMVSVNMDFEMINCFYESSKRKDCSNNFHVNVYAGKEDELNNNNIEKLYHSTKVVRAKKVDTSIKSFENNITFFVNDLQGLDGIRLEIENMPKTACANIKSITVYYYMCPSKSGNLVNFKRTAAPDKNTEMLKVSGSCIDNSVIKSGSDTYMNCYYNGSFELFGGCSCKAGYEKINRNCQG